MRPTHFVRLVLPLGFVAVFLAACGGAGPRPQPSPGATVPVSLTLRDTPPAGVTILSFEIMLTGTVLQPGAVSLLSKPIEVELTQLQIETAFLNTAKAAPGTYSSITATFANPELTILNNSGGAIGGCANGAVCELKPSLSPGSVTYSGPPFPLTLSTPVRNYGDVLFGVTQHGKTLSHRASP